MAKEYKHEIQFEKKRPVRTKVVKVTLFDSEFKLLEDKNPYNSVAKLLRESALKAVKQEEVHTSTYSKLDRDFILELSRIGTNINQNLVNLIPTLVDLFHVFTTHRNIR